VREERKAAGIKPGPPPKPRATNGAAKPPPIKPAAPKGPSKNARRRQADLERAVERAEAELAALEDELAAPAAWATKYESAKSTARHTAAKLAVEAAYAALAEHEETAATG
jgi:ATP-binding cassette, subfamily F, member 3